MDVFASAQLGKALSRRGRENYYNDGRYSKTLKSGSNLDWVDVTSSVIAFIIFVSAFYLSWNCQLNQGLGIGARVVYALTAGTFGLIYIIFYALSLTDQCGNIPIFDPIETYSPDYSYRRY